MPDTDDKLRFAAPALLCLWSGYLGISVLLEGRPKAFWSTDTSLYFRLLVDPDQMRYTLPVVNQVLEQAPTLFLDIARLMLGAGFDPANLAHGTWLFGVVNVISSLCVTTGCFLITRSLDVGRLPAVFAAVLATSCWVFFEHSRPHELHTVVDAGYVSMLANAGFLLSFGLAATGRYLRAGLVAGVTCWLHAVAGPLACIAVGLLALVDALRCGFRRKDLLRLFQLAALMTVVGSPFLVKAVAYIAAPQGSFDPAAWLTYVWFRSANPMPLRDGLPLILARFLMIAVVAAAAPASGRGRMVLLTGAAFVAACILLQIAFGELLASPGLTALVLHRVTTLLPLLMVAALVYRLSLAAEANPTGPWLVVLAASSMLVWTKLYVLRGLTHWESLGGSRVDTGGDYAAAALVIWLLCVAAVYFGRRDMRGFLVLTVPFVVLLASGLAVALALLSIDVCGQDVGCTIQNFGQNGLFRAALLFAVGVTVVLLFWFFMQLFLGRSEQLRSIFSHGRVLTLAWSVAMVLAVSINIRQYDGFRLAEYRYEDVKRLVVAQTSPQDVVFSTIAIDLIGVRRQYLDWEYEWYSLYAPDALTSLLQRLAVLDMRLDPDDVAECGGGRWLFRYRCFEAFGNIRTGIFEADWRAYAASMANAEPNLRYAVVPEDQVVEGDNVIARAAGIAMVAPEAWSRH